MELLKIILNNFKNKFMVNKKNKIMASLKAYLLDNL